MRRIVAFSCFLFLSAMLFAQQETMYTQFMLNKMYYNPGAAGSFVSPTLRASYRNQWMGQVDGAPTSAMISFDAPVFRNKVGLGGGISMSKVAITRIIAVDFNYAYKIPMRRGHLAIGVKPVLRNYYQNWADPRLVATQSISTDNGIPKEPQSKIVVNMNAGVYYESRKWYFGFAAQRLIPISYDFADYGSVYSTESLHFNMMGGSTIELQEDVLTITPQVLVRYALGAPIDADVNGMLSYRNKFFGGLTYRTGGDVSGLGESLDVLTGLQATPNLYVGLTYDIGLTRLKKFHNGSIEAMARWYFNPPEGREIINPGNIGRE